MARQVVWLAGVLVSAVAVVLLLVDGAKLVTGSSPGFTPLGQVWTNLHSNSLLLLQPAIERHIEPRIGDWLWDPVVLSILTAPAWLVIGVAGALLMLIGRRKKPRLGSARDRIDFDRHTRA